jgi:hypothetical protein
MFLLTVPNELVIRRLCWIRYHLHVLIKFTLLEPGQRG